MTTDTTQQLTAALADLADLDKEATGWPWNQEHEGSCIVHGPNGTVAEMIYNPADAALTAALRNILPLLLATAANVEWVRALADAPTALRNRFRDAIADRIGRHVTDWPGHILLAAADDVLTYLGQAGEATGPGLCGDAAFGHPCVLPKGHDMHLRADQLPAVPTGRPRVIVLCGSTRFKDEFERVNGSLTLGGHIVLAPGVFGHADGIELTEASKAALDALHLRKIDTADEVLIVNPGGYIGDSTRAEIAYAERTGKIVMYVHPEYVDTVPA